VARLSLDLLTSRDGTRQLALPALLVLALAGLAQPSAAQLSPGPLSQAHADLEGVRHCTSCHDADRQDVRAGCLACHHAVAARVAEGRGLHAGENYAACETCHHEHLGRDFALISWPDRGPSDFDHASVGFVLEGRHATVACRECHRPARIETPERLRSGKVDLERTYLGLSTDCAGCHPDPHRDQFGGDCARCHRQTEWRLAATFDHSRTAFPLVGAHAAVTCERCHPALDGAGTVPGARRYRGVAHGGCVDCHTDPHGGRLGADCNGCHETAAWSARARDSFDHARTAFPLRGRHAQLACAACHGGRQRGQPLPHAACIDCHRDAHAARTAGEASWLRCEQCHDESGFQPARFTLAEHDSTAFPLVGAHRAQPCVACHRAASGSGSAPGAPPLALPHATCEDCHGDPHGPELARLSGGDGCRACHREDSWRDVRFAHDRTGWPLAGRHADIACRDCHTPVGLSAASSAGPAVARQVAAPTSAVALVFAGVPRACVSCHVDPHRGQFGGDATPVAGDDCARCHAPDAWRPARFDHDRQSRFPLTGAHRQVACARCHPLERDAAGEFARYRPRGTDCADCHGTAVPSTAKEQG